MNPTTTQKMADVPNTVHNLPRRVVTDDKAAMIAMLREQGVTTKGIAETLGLSTSTVYKAGDYMRRSGKIPLLSPKRIKKATRAIDAFIEGKPVGEVQPKCSTVLAAANAVLDRAFPKAQDDSGKGNVSYTQINISLASTPDTPAVDITPSAST